MIWSARHLKALFNREAVWLVPEDLDATTLLLRRLTPIQGPPVLLVHGLSAQSNTFEIIQQPPGRDGLRPPRLPLAAHLAAIGFTVWTVDHRGSSRPTVLEALQEAWARAPDRVPAAFTFGNTASHDIGRAIREVAARHDTPVHVVAHCVGAGLTALALAADPTLPVGNLVLSTLGLFYRAPLIRKIKVSSLIADYFAAEASGWLDVWDDWSSRSEPYRKLQRAQDAWLSLRAGRALAPPSGPPHFDRIAFLVGEPYLQAHMEAIDEDPPTIWAAFGAMSVPLMVDVADNLRAGRPTDPCRAAALGGVCVDDPGGDPFDPTPFIDRNVMLLTGRHNRLWHPSSITTMYGWLLDRGARRDRLRQWILPGYGHQDLLWGQRADVDVYPLIADALRAPMPRRAAVHPGFSLRARHAEPGR